jgi:hypothetical protein
MKCKFKPNNNSSLIGCLKHFTFWYLRIIQAKFLDPINNDINCVFIVGCGNSGTTLLNARLGMNPKIYSIPEETSWFIPITPSLKEIRTQILFKMDIARKDNKTILLEKTPKHVHCINTINLMITNKKFIFILRNPFSTVSSLKKRFNSFEIALDRYILDNSVLNNIFSTFLLVRYEDLVSDTENLMQRICDYLNVEYSILMSKGESNTYDQTSFHQLDNMSIRKIEVKKEIYSNQLYNVDSLSQHEIDLIYKKTRSLIYKHYPNIDYIYESLK